MVLVSVRARMHAHTGMGDGMFSFMLYGRTYVLAQTSTLLVALREHTARAALHTAPSGWDYDDGAHPGVYA